LSLFGLEETRLPAPSGRRGTRNTVNPSGHVGLVRRPVSAAIVPRQLDPRVMRSHAVRARNSARKTVGEIPYATANPRDTVSGAKPFAFAHVPICIEVLRAKVPASRSGQSSLLPGGEGGFSLRMCSRRTAASRTLFSAVRANASTSFKR
jgi:hypothetical protein